MATPACSSRSTQPVKVHPEASSKTFKGNFFSTPGHANGFQKPVSVIRESSILTLPFQNSARADLNRGYDQVSAPIRSSGPTSIQQSNTIGSLAHRASISNTLPSLQGPFQPSYRPLNPPDVVPDASEILARLAKQRAQLDLALSPGSVEASLRSRESLTSRGSVVTDEHARGPVSAPITQLPKKSSKIKGPRKRRVRASTPKGGISKVSTSQASASKVQKSRTNTARSNDPNPPDCADDSSAHPSRGHTFSNHGKHYRIAQRSDAHRQSDFGENFLLRPQDKNQSPHESPSSSHQHSTQNSTLSNSTLLHAQKHSDNTEAKSTEVTMAFPQQSGNDASNHMQMRPQQQQPQVGYIVSPLSSASFIRTSISMNFWQMLLEKFPDIYRYRFRIRGLQNHWHSSWTNPQSRCPTSMPRLTPYESG